MQLFRLLQGEVFSRKEAPVLDAMREYIEKVENADNHLFKSKLMQSVPID